MHIPLIGIRLRDLQHAMESFRLVAEHRQPFKPPTPLQFRQLCKCACCAPRAGQWACICVNGGSCVSQMGQGLVCASSNTAQASCPCSLTSQISVVIKPKILQAWKGASVAPLIRQGGKSLAGHI